MKFQSVAQAAERLNVNVRTIQKWAKEGKIPYAYKDGRDWKIPVNSLFPSDCGELFSSFHNEPYPIIHTYTPGKALEYIDSIENEDDRNMALCQYYYLTGEMKKSTIISEQYLDSKRHILRTSSALFCIFANICRGHMVKARYATEILTEDFHNSLSSQDSFIKAFNVFTALVVNTQLHLQVKDIPPMVDYMKYLDGGLKLFSCYLTAYKAYLDKDYSKSLGIVETALNISQNVFPVAMIYLYLIRAMAYVSLMKIDEAHESIEKAWEFASPDGMFIPFVEHYSLLQGLVEKHFKRDHPSDYRKIIEAVKQYNMSWYELYNQKNKNAVADNLTHTEFTIAMLYSRNWRAKEIAAHMDLSESTIKNYIQVIYEKLCISGKKELSQFMLS